MQGVASQWKLDLNVAGKTLNANPTTMPYFHIINNIHQHLPSIKFTYKDASPLVAELSGIKDGTPIICTVGTTEEQYSGLQFASLGQPKYSSGNGSAEVTINGSLNKPEYMRKVVDKAYKGNSSQVLSQIMGEIGLIPDVHHTNDKMTWLPISKTIASMARHIAGRGWAGDTSCMICAVTDSGKFRYHNVAEIIKSGPKKVFASDGQSGMLVLDWKADPKSHIGNAMRGYGSTTGQMTPEGVLKEVKEVSMTMLSQALPFASSMMSLFGGGPGKSVGVRFERAPLNAGNTHEKWVEAIHQNSRIQSTFAYDVYILIDKPSFVELLDLVEFKPLNPNTGQIDATVAGKYIVTAITKTIHGQRYWEKITLTSQGANG